MRRYAAVVLCLKPHKMLRRHVVEVADDGRLMTCYPLQEELPFTQWLQGMLIVLPGGEDPRSHLHDLFDWWDGLLYSDVSEEDGYVWHVSTVIVRGERVPDGVWACLLGRL